MEIRRTTAHISATIVLAVAVAACTTTGVPGSPNRPSGVLVTDAPPPSTGGAVPGGWQGTITVRLVRNVNITENHESGDPGSVYHTTSTTNDVVVEDITDTFTVTGSDGDDVEYGVVEVDLTGQAANEGDTLQRHVSVTDKHNSLGCHFTEEIGSEIDGSWTLGGEASGTIRFTDDGTYSITIGGGDSGEEPLDKRLWQINTILEGAAIDCPPAGTVADVTDFGQYGAWAYPSLEDEIEGTLNPTNPGSVVEGTRSFDIELPWDATITVSWSLVHEGPINLPHDGPPPEEL